MYQSTLRSRLSYQSKVQPVLYPIPDRADYQQRQTPTRLQRIRNDWMPLQNSSFLSRITVLEEGGKERPVVTRGGKHLRFRFYSQKTGRYQVGEGVGEYYLALFNDFSSTVGDWQGHHVKIETRPQHEGKGRSFKSFPDSMRMLRTGQVEVIEVKRSEDDLYDRDYREAIAHVRELCRQLGWDFIVRYEDEIMQVDTPLISQLTKLATQQCLELSREEQRVANRLLRDGDRMTWAEMRNIVAPDDPMRGDDVIEHLISQCRLETPLNVQFGDDTVLRMDLPPVPKSRIRI